MSVAMRSRIPCALVFVAALAAPPGWADEGRVTYLSAERVEAAFAVGAPLLEQGDLKVHASRRAAAGLVEVHERDTDVIHVLSGTAVFVTGGRLVGAREIAEGEIRGATIEGGETRTLQPGDVIVVPRGVPHWFREVPGPFTYYVVKVDGTPR